MPLVAAAGTPCYYRLDGGDDRPVLMLAHSLGQDHGMWDRQAEDLAPHFRVLRYDLRGHGASACPDGDCRIEDLARDALALADALDIRTFAFCGLSIGGMIGQWLAAHTSERLTAVVLANTSARADGPAMERRRQAVLDGGLDAVAGTVMARFFSPRMLAANPPVVARARRTLLATDPRGYAACCAAIRDMDQRSRLAAIRVPALVVNGERDVSLPWRGHGEVLAEAIPNARVVHLRAAHLSNLEAPRAFTAALYGHLLPSAAADQGSHVRRLVLGDAHVDRAIAASDGFTSEFQDFLTRFAWGGVWTRPGLDHRTRRLLVLVMTASLGRWDEFRLHVKAGLQSEQLEACDVKEALLQTAVYAGVPAANTAFRIAAEELSLLE